MRISQIVVLAVMATVSANAIAQKLSSIKEEAKRRIKDTSNTINSAYQQGMKKVTDLYKNAKSEAVEKTDGVKEKINEATEKYAGTPEQAKDTPAVANDEESEIDSTRANEIFEMLHKMFEKQNAEEAKKEGQKDDGKSAEKKDDAEKTKERAEL